MDFAGPVPHQEARLGVPAYTENLGGHLEPSGHLLANSLASPPRVTLPVQDRAPLQSSANSIHVSDQVLHREHDDDVGSGRGDVPCNPGTSLRVRFAFSDTGMNDVQTIDFAALPHEPQCIDLTRIAALACVVADE